MQIYVLKSVSSSHYEVFIHLILALLEINVYITGLPNQSLQI